MRLEEAQENSQVKSFTNIEMLLGLFISVLIRVLDLDPDPDPGGIRGRGLGVKGKNNFFFFLSFFHVSDDS